MMMRWVLLVLFAMTIAGGCISAQQEAKNLTFETVYKSTEFGIALPSDWHGKIPFFQLDPYKPKYSSPPAYEVILNKTEWDYLFTPYKPLPPSVDFNTEFVIAYGFIHHSGGTTVEIPNVTQSADTISIVVVDHPPKGEVVTMAVTYPHHIIKIKKSELLQRGNLTFSFVYVDGTQLENVTRFVP